MSTKTSKEWFDTLPSPYREQALTNTPYEDWRRPMPRLTSAIAHGFSWASSPEGVLYWEDLFGRARSGEFDVAPDPACPAPRIPSGFSRWEYRGMGWRPGVRKTYCTSVGEDPSRWGGTANGAPPQGYKDLHYWEAIKDPSCDAPLPDGFSHWEYRGRGWDPGRDVVHACRSENQTTASWSDVACETSGSGIGKHFHYWEAIKGPSVAAGHRLLSVGELTRAGDEFWDANSGTWREVVACVVTEIRSEIPRRRAVTSYEDAPPKA